MFTVNIYMCLCKYIACFGPFVNRPSTKNEGRPGEKGLEASLLKFKLL